MLGRRLGCRGRGFHLAVSLCRQLSLAEGSAVVVGAYSAAEQVETCGFNLDRRLPLLLDCPAVDLQRPRESFHRGEQTLLQVAQQESGGCLHALRFAAEALLANFLVLAEQRSKLQLGRLRREIAQT